MSKIRWNTLSKFPWYVLLISLYVPMQLGAHNIGQIPLNSIYRSVFVSGLLGLAILFLFRLVLHNWIPAGLGATIVIILMLSYGQVYFYVEGLQVGKFLIGRHRYLLLLWMGLAVVGIPWIVRHSNRLGLLSSVLNKLTLVLLLFPVVELVVYSIRSSQTNNLVGSESQQSYSLQPVDATAPHNLPDVYYIILDAYGRSDVLSKYIGFDNSLFLNRLRDMGFYVADCAQSNYAKTDLSLSSSLNLNYVTTLDPSLRPNRTDRLPLWNLIKNNAVKATFKKMGYTTMAFETGFEFSHLNNLDVFYTPPRKGFNEFEMLYLRTTMAVLLDDEGVFARFHYTPEDRKRELILFDLKTLSKIPSIPGPKFVFAHLVIPHQPFVFAPNGDPFVVPERINKGTTYYTQQDYITGYRNQTIFISNQIVKIVWDIVKNSATPPIIIIQGDHGPNHFGEPQRMGILNAYYFPGANGVLYDTITPVNSFRLLFNTYFGTHYDLLDDVSYYSKYPMAYQFDVVPNQCRGKVL